MKIKELLLKIKTRSLTDDERNFAWQKISNRINQPSAPMSSILKYKMLGRAFAAALLIILISVPSARAANNARPGDFLFPVDRALEEIQLILASRDEEDSLKIKFAEERIEEVRSVLAELHGGGSDTAPDETPKPKNNERAVQAVSTALAFVSDVQNDLTEKNNSNALKALAAIADRLNSDLADNLPEGTEIEIKIKNKKQGIKIITESEDGAKKVKIEIENGNIKTKGPTTNVLDILKQLDVEDDDEDEGDDDDDDDDRDRKSGKVTICHLPGGKIEKGRTISVSANALQAHLKHGDFEGSCDGQDDDDDDDGDEDENTKPIITLLGDNPIELTVGDDFTDPGATADDIEDGDITSDIIVGGDAVATTTPGTYVITYDVVDSEGLAADQVSRTINVNEPENTKPTIILTGDNPIDLTVGDDFTDPGATADDTEDGDITDDIVVGGDAVATSTPGTYVITYDVTDSEGLAADQVSRTVNVNEPPPACSDDIDNDDDGLIDEDDPGCHTDNDETNTGSYDPNDDDETDAADNQEAQSPSNETHIAQAAENNSTNNGNSGSANGNGNDGGNENGNSGNNGQGQGNNKDKEKGPKGNQGKNNN